MLPLHKNADCNYDYYETSFVGKSATYQQDNCLLIVSSLLDSTINTLVYFKVKNKDASDWYLIIEMMDCIKQSIGKDLPLDIEIAECDDLKSFRQLVLFKDINEKNIDNSADQYLKWAKWAKRNYINDSEIHKLFGITKQQYRFFIDGKKMSDILRVYLGWSK